MATIVQKPANLVGAFNPLLLEISKGSEQSSEIQILVDNEPYSLEREYINNKVRYNLSDLIKNGFKNEQTQVIENVVFVDKLLSVEFGSNDDGLEFQSLAINAVSQRKGTYDMTSMQGKFLTGFESLKKYKDYPLLISFLTFPNPDTTYLNVNGITVNDDSFTKKHLTFSIPNETNKISITHNKLTTPLLTNSGNEVRTNNNELIVVSTGVVETESDEEMNVGQSCKPESQFYIRWINRLGGWDCWMFKNRQFLKSELKKVETFYPTIDDYIPGPPNSETVLSAEASETVIAGEENLTENEFDNLQLLKYSPFIQVYNKDTKEWSRIYLEKSENEKDTKNTRFSVEFEFTLPMPKLQF